MSNFNLTNIAADPTRAPQYQVDSTIIKMFLASIKEGNLQTIKNNIEKYNFDVKMIKDSQYDQNALFYAALIPDDNK